MNPYIFTGLPHNKQHQYKFRIKQDDPDAIIKGVSDVLRLDPSDILGLSRKRTLVEARQICIGLIIAANPALTLEKLGEIFSRDLSTIIYHREVYNSLMKHDKTFQDKVSRVRVFV